MKISEKRENSQLAMGRSMIGGGDGASVAEVAASLPARRLGAMKNWEVLKVWTKEKEEKGICLSKKKFEVLFKRS